MDDLSEAVEMYVQEVQRNLNGRDADALRPIEWASTVTGPALQVVKEKFPDVDYTDQRVMGRFGNAASKYRSCGHGRKTPNQMALGESSVTAVLPIVTTHRTSGKMNVLGTLRKLVSDPAIDFVPYDKWMEAAFGKPTNNWQAARAMLQDEGFVFERNAHGWIITQKPETEDQRREREEQEKAAAQLAEWEEMRRQCEEAIKALKAKTPNGKK